MQNPKQNKRLSSNKTYLHALKTLISQLEKGRVVASRMQINMEVAPSNKGRDLTRCVNNLSRNLNGQAKNINQYSVKDQKVKSCTSICMDKINFLISKA